MGNHIVQKAVKKYFIKLGVDTLRVRTLIGGLGLICDLAVRMKISRSTIKLSLGI